MSTLPPVPVVLVAGFLGSGKTTLMRRLIVDASRRGLRAAVIVNEFGTADVDSNILREADAELIAAIAGGCACCTGQDDLRDTLFELGARPAPTRPAVVLVEASGLADPVLLLDVMTEGDLLPLLAPRCVIAVVDGARYLELVNTLAPLLRRQIQLADTILLNKTDLAPATGQVAAKLRTANKHAAIILTQHCDAPLDAMWARAGSDAMAPSGANVEGAAEAAHTHYHTVWCPLPHPLERDKLEAALRDLPPEVWRAKGFVHLRGHEGLQLVQYTGGGGQGRFHIAGFFLPAGFKEPAAGLVFIGAALDRAALLQRFAGDNRLIAFL